MFCPKCGGNLTERLLKTEDRPRLICDSCGHIFYENPKVVAAALLVQEGKVILLRRGIEPRRGTWTFPAGFMELGETVEEAAIRETKEETNLDVRIISLLNVYSRPKAGIVTIVYLAEVMGGQPTASREALEIASFQPGEIPWEELAFESTEWALRDWVRLVTKGLSNY